MDIALLDDYQDSVRHLDCFRMLDGHAVKTFTNSTRGLGQLAIRLANFDVLVLNRDRTPLPRQLLVRLPKLKCIVQIGSAGTHLDVEAAQTRGIVVREVEEAPYVVAEATWALIMAARRKLAQYAALLKLGAWQASSLFPQHNSLGHSLRGQTLGLLGYDDVARQVAAYAQAFGMQIVVWSGEEEGRLAQQDGCCLAPSRASLFGEADVLSVHLPPSDATQGIVSLEDLARMKPDALFVNTSHAGLLAPGALEAALQQGRPGSAALDVFEQEPLPKDAPLLQMENVLATPHIGSLSRQHAEALYGAAFRHILDFANSVSRST